MQTFYMTFGGPLIDNYVRIVAPDMDVARAAAFDIHGTKFCTVRGDDFDRKQFCPRGELYAVQTDEYLNYKRLS